MRPLEAVLLVVTVLAAVWALGPWRHRRTAAAVVVVAGFAALMAQAGLEGLRWQLVPVQAAGVVLVVVAVTVIVRARPLPAQRLLGSVMGVVALFGGAIAWLLPVLTLPTPAGTAAVGTVTVALTDHDRPERYGSNPGAPREIVAQVWYPADADAASDPAPFVADLGAFGLVVTDELGLPGFVAGHLALLETHATPAAPPEPPGQGGHPLVVYSHGWSGLRTIQASLMEELASHGYVTVALDHTFASLATVFPDGRVEGLDPRALPGDVSSDAYRLASEQLVATFAADIDLLLDQLASEGIAPLQGGIDLDRVALVGHSTGGGAAVYTCALSDRCDAVVGFDPWVEPVPDDIIGAGLDVPLLSIRSEEWSETPNDKRLRRLHAATTAAEGRVEIHGSLHRDFTLVPMLSPGASFLGLSGTTPGERTHEITHTWTLRFLDHHLRGRGGDPLLSPPTFPESKLEKAAG